ncbi:hypothetical protein A3A39_01870 [Candidatus Kaiserbacteria bacterium RIFCSPLOWO2_01_FULL_54_13]|uniref:Uncharacterized protein n=1 Tax=Candidatus Kaiserbacteria bacterium RIFCSPLOWO2_01_FULL_54_13 TaxID=1798512 RepID=A0A1F6F0A7_9BACT|nr:MAG: hypothetical protein A3A39_01870 [Candidatus Kaiserbacteria bacterium RIFCSPLOWO2_01_FULL_54_13]
MLTVSPGRPLGDVLRGFLLDGRTIVGLFFAVVFAFGIAILESDVTPGYGPVSQLIRSPEAIASARAVHAERTGHKALIESITKRYKNVYCPEPTKWATLSPQDRQRWHDYWQSQKLTLIEGSTLCYDP